MPSVEGGRLACAAGVSSATKNSPLRVAAAAALVVAIVLRLIWLGVEFGLALALYLLGYLSNGLQSAS